MTKPLPSTAFFLPPRSSENNGVDFLGLRQANLSMMGDIFPGTNNVTAYIRPFSLLSWIFWKFHALWERDQKSDPTGEALRLFRERIEVLFTWGAKLEDVAQIPGKSAEPPAGTDVELTFDAWKRTQDSTSLIAALWYGPASKTATGLGFLDPVGSGFFRTVGQGVKLAEALDSRLRSEPETYERLLDTLTQVTATEDDALKLWQTWGTESSTKIERSAFQSALFSTKSVGEYESLLGKRSSTIALAILHLSQSQGPHTLQQIRRGMLSSQRSDDTVYDVPTHLQLAHKKWACLQVRQLQRLATETLFSWCERKILDGATDTNELTTGALDIIQTADTVLQSANTLADVFDAWKTEFETLDQFLEVSRSNASFSVLDLIQKIQTQFKDHEEEVAATCLYSMILCAAFGKCSEPDQTALVSVGGAPRLSILQLSKRLHALEDAPIQDAIQFIIENMIISQHLATAVSRFDGQNQRLRLTIEEHGLTPLVREPWHPTVTEDRLLTILNLAADCDLIDGNEDGFSFREPKESKNLLT